MNEEQKPVVTSNDSVPSVPAAKRCPIVECRHLKKQYQGGKIALSDLNLAIYGGRIIGLLGPNGSGKTTLIKLISGLLTPTSGEILINGKAPGIESKAHISYLPERTYLNSWMRVEEILHYFEDFYSDFRIEKARALLDQLKIKTGDRLRTLSKGTKEKVQLVLVMSRDADLYLLDEPIGGVDPAARDLILDTILKHYNPSASVIISTHLITDVERVLDDVIFLSQGDILMAGSADDVRAHYQKTLDEIFREEYRC